MTPRYRIIQAVLVAAKDSGDEHMVETCRRLILADSIGWKKYASRLDWQAVLAFEENLRAA